MFVYAYFLAYCLSPQIDLNICRIGIMFVLCLAHCPRCDCYSKTFFKWQQLLLLCVYLSPCFLFVILMNVLKMFLICQSYVRIFSLPYLQPLRLISLAWLVRQFLFSCQSLRGVFVQLTTLRGSPEGKPLILQSLLPEPQHSSQDPLQSFDLVSICSVNCLCMTFTF